MEGALEMTEETRFSLSLSAEGGEACLKRLEGGTRGTFSKVPPVRILIFLLCLCLCLSAPTAALAGRIAFLGFDGDYWQVFVKDEQGGAAVKATTSPFDKSDVSVDREHLRLYYAGSSGRLFAKDLAGGPEIPVDLVLEGMTDAVISPDGSRAAFSMSTAGGRDTHDVWVFDLKTRRLRKATNDPGLQFAPSWCPDGRRLLYIGGEDPRNFDVFLLDPDTGSKAQLTAGGLYNLGAELSIHDDLVFSSNREGSYDLYVLSLKGGEPRRLTSEPSYEGEPAWSPDGSRIVYVSTRTGARRLHIIQKDGSGGRMIPCEIPARNPLWLD